ncbi:MAG: hypothetical protein IPO78_01850 [Saprospiraceae bacterium]|nr:hypothetical protein [Saprospiraceae bacterium]MBK9222612.1 hypothetical protein [Saprospiraceae bacterium]MBK9720345.1 hypothetical protein [Saprospiraceae bacterium]
MRNFNPLVLDSNQILYINSVLTLNNRNIGILANSGSNNNDPQYISAPLKAAYFCWTAGGTCKGGGGGGTKFEIIGSPGAHGYGGRECEPM